MRAVNRRAQSGAHGSPALPREVHLYSAARECGPLYERRASVRGGASCVLPVGKAFVVGNSNERDVRCIFVRNFLQEYTSPPTHLIMKFSDLSIEEIRAQFLHGNQPVTAQFLTKLSRDPRQGVRKMRESRLSLVRN